MIQPSLFKAKSEWCTPTEFPDLSKYDEIAIDLETKDPDLTKKGSCSVLSGGDVVGIAVAVSNWCGYYPIAHEGGGNMNRKQVLKWFTDVLKTPAKKIFHNAMYDVCWIRRLGLTVHGTIIDTMIAAAVVDENLLRYDLGSLGKRYVGFGKNETALYEAAKDWGVNPKAEMYKLPAIYVGEYAEKDAELTLALWQEMKKEILYQEVESIFNLEMDLFPCLVEMKWKGVRIDMDQLESVEKQLTKRLKVHMDYIRAETKLLPDIWAARSIAKVFDYLKIGYPRTAKTEAPSFTKKFLKKHHNPIIRSIVSARQADKLINTFTSTLKNYVHEGRIHPDINQLRSEGGGTITGRFSYSHPNLQQLPAYADIGKSIRSIFIPEENCTWGCFDYSQQEPRLVVHYALQASCLGVGSIAEKYHKPPIDSVTKLPKPVDFHQIVAEMANIGRKKAKTINLGLFYGMGINKLQGELGLATYEEAKKTLDAYHLKVPFVKQLMQSTMKRAQEKGKIRTLLGRLCRFHQWEPREFGRHKPMSLEEALREHAPEEIKRAFTYKALNKLIQGSAADMTKKAMLELYKEGIIPHVQVHDELDISVEDDKQAEKIIQIMEEAVPLKVPNKVDYEKGENWGTVQDLKEKEENGFNLSNDE